MKATSTRRQFINRKTMALFAGLLVLLISTTVNAQLGVYSFTGSGGCPNANDAVNSQPANATFSNYTTVNTSCQNNANVFDNKQWNTGNTIDLSQYNQFTVTPNAGFILTLTDISLTQLVDDIPSSGTTEWHLRSSLDGYAADIASGTANTSSQSPTITLPAANFTNIAAVTFRFYITNIKGNGTVWSNDDLTINGTVTPLPAIPANPTSNSPQCSTPGVTMNFTGSAPAGETWYWQTSASGTSTANSTSSYTVNTSGTYYVRSQDNTTLLWSNGAGSITVTITPDVSTPVFTLGASSTRCQGAGTSTYTATASNSGGIAYSLDAASITGNNTINAATGEVTWDAGWSGTSTITATASGCGSPTTATHTVTINGAVTTPVFTMGATSLRCQGAGTVTYAATASNATGITYSLDATTAAFAGNSINASTGTVTYAAGWSGTTIITASAAGCGGPLTATHTVTITPTVGTPVFTLGATSTRCQGAGNVTYTATASNNQGITYTLDAASTTAGNSINAATGEVTYTAGWNNTSTITATATGCNGPKTATHTVTNTSTIGIPVFSSGTTSTRCQGAGSITYTATSAGASGMSYALDATSLSNGNSINAATGAVTYAAGWSGTSTITATATGCNGPTTGTHTVTITPTVGTPVFTLGATSTRCQGAGVVQYQASASDATAITYSMTAAGGSTINSTTGDVTWVAGFSGSATITASAAGCNGPKTATHTVTVTPTVGNPTFTLGATSTRCIGAGTVTYTANATNNQGITYSLDATSLAGGNTINATTGAVTYDAAWTGASTITATATGCNGPKTASHVATTNNNVATPIFALGATSSRCLGSGTVTYTATATNSTGITYSLDALSLIGGNTINASTGAVSYSLTWVGSSTITASAAGCGGPQTATHTVTINAAVTTPVFASGSSSTRCQGAGTVTYTATSNNATTLTYSLDASSSSGGNTINSATGEVTYVASWSGTTTVTATATGCNGPRSATHTVTVTPTVGTPVFSAGATSTRCQGANTVTYTATASNSTSRTYSLDATSLAAGNTINSTTGAVTYVANWVGTSVISVTAAGCNGPSASVDHTATSTPSVTAPVFTLGATSTRCQGAATVAYTATASNTTGITYSIDAASVSGGNSINASTGNLTFSASWSGTTTVTASAAGCNGPVTATHTITITPTVATPVFAAGNTSTRCQGAGTVTYTATATNNTGITYSLDATSLGAGNTINTATGEVTYDANWSGTSVITASAAGCNGPRTRTHTVTITATVGTPVFTLGATSTRCQGNGSVSYAATASASTSITYSLDAVTDAFPGNSINSSSGTVTYASGWSGTTTITATANGCSGPTTATHTVTITPTVGTPVFTAGSTSTRCQGAGTVNYGASATNTTGITYSLNAAALSGGNTINATTGDVTYVAGWTGSTVITASAAGCNGPKTATHTVTITPTVGNPSFTMGTSSTRCQGGNTVTYTASATNTTGLVYSLDAASLTGGNTINASTGAVTYASTWNGTTTVTVTASGCNGPKTATHTVTIIPTVGAPVFALGSTSTRCQAGGLVSYTATATNSTNITYSLDAASTSGGNSINSTTGTVAYAAAWTGTSVITASASGCNGPVTSTHTVTITPTVGTPAFTLGATSTRCQGAGVVTYTANATNTTGITYTLDASSLAGGNTINASTGDVTYAAGWYGTTTITATAAGCNGPKTASHTVTITATVGTPVFTMGAQSTRTQGAGTVTYTATATNSTGINYSLDASSLAGGNTINTATGAVTWVATWNGTSMITASATGCNGPSTGSHIVTINPAVVQAPLYLSTGQTLDRIDPVATNITTTLQTADLSSVATTNVTFTLVPSLCSPLVVKAQTISVITYVSITSGTMPANPNITAQIKYGSTNILTLTNPVYNAGNQTLNWTAVLGADVTVPTGQAIALQVTTAQAGVVFKIQYHSNTKPSRISLFPVSTFIDIISFNVYNAPYPGGAIRNSGNPGTTMYARAVVTTPFGYTDITKLTINFTPPGSTVNVTCVDSTSCSRTYEYPWTIPSGYGNIAIMATAYEGFENNIKNSEVVNFATCLVCAPVAVTDSAVGAGGAPITVDVLANDYDPNNNIKPSTLAISVQPNNGSGYIANGKIVYLPNGSYSGRDTLTYQICDSTALCSTGQVYFTINPLLIDPCSQATKTHTYFIPYPEQDAWTALQASSASALPGNTIRTVISLTMPYPGMTIVWDEWEDGYEDNPLNPTQSTTKVWGDGNPYNGIAPGYTTDIIPAGGSIVLDNTMPANPRVQANIFYDGKDKITASGQVAVTQVCGEPTNMPVQAIKTNVTSTFDFGQSFTIPLGQNYPSRDFLYTALFVRAEQDSTVVDIDKDNNGTFETNFTLNEGQSYLVNGGVLYGATVTSNKPVGVELNAGGVDGFSIRNAPIYPATWYSNTYYTPVPTSDNAADNPKDTSVVMLYNSLNRAISVNWNSGAPANGVINIPAKSVVRFPLAYSTTSAYKFTNPTGEAFTAIEIVDSYSPNTGTQDGSTYDWAFNLISEPRLTDFATTAWAPGGLDLIAPAGPDVNGNPIWVTPNVNTTIYVKWDGKVSGTSGLVSPCGLRYDSAIVLNALKYVKLRDLSDNDQSGLAVYTCNGAKIAAVYGEDPQGSSTGIGIAYWDVGTTILPFCKQKLIFANDDYARTMVNQPVTIPVLLNDFGFLAVIDPATVNNAGLLLAKHGSISINPNGTIIYTPDPGYVGKDTFEYGVCSTPSPTVCDNARVYVDIAVCPAPFNQNVIGGQAFLDKNEDGINNDGGEGFAGAKVYLYVDGNCNSTIDANELKDSVTVDVTGRYQFVTYPEKFVADDFDGTGGTNTCASGNDGNAAWIGNWTDIGDPSVGFCNNTQTAANTDVEIKMDNAFGYALRLKDANRSATRTVNLNGASYAFLTFSYRRKSATLTAGKNVIVQASKDGSTFGTVFTIAGDGNTDANYVTIYNQDITQYAAATTYLRFLTNGSVADADTVYIDNIKIQFIRYPQCYITKLDPASVPAFHHTTTILQHNFTATSAQTCLAPYDFGIAKNKIAVSGSLFNDPNGLTDNLINGTAMGIVTGQAVYAYLVDGTGNVAYRTTLVAGGTFSFPAVDILTNFTLRLSTTSVNVGEPAPANAALPSGWLPTGDCYGINNSAGIGNSAYAPVVGIAVNTGTVNVTGVNFGIERLPDSDDKFQNYTKNTPGLQYAVPGLTGSDAEDGLLGSGKTYKITSVPDNAVLFYNGALVSVNTVITSFNPALFLIDPSDTTHISTFTYAAMDAAGLYDPSPATVTITWSQTLPVKLISFSGRLNGTRVDLNWVTANELNTKHFEVERGTDGRNFTPIATVAARGNSNTPTSYDLVDPAPLKGVNYYRLKMVDTDGKFEYSQIVIIRIEDGVQLVTKIAPNPFTGKIDVYLTLTHNTQVDFRFIDINGRMVFSKSVKGLKGFNWFTINDLDRLPSAPYMLHIKTDDATIVEKLIKQQQ